MTRCHFLPFADDWRGKQILEKWPSCTFSTWPAQRRRQTPVILSAFIESFCLVEISVVELRRPFFPELQGFISSYFPLLHLAAAFFVFFLLVFALGSFPWGAPGLVLRSCQALVCLRIPSFPSCDLFDGIR